MTQQAGKELERLARIIRPGAFKSELSLPEAKKWQKRAQESARDTARAILQALAEPSEGTVEAGVDAGWVQSNGAKHTFTAMINHILNEGEG